MLRLVQSSTSLQPGDKILRRELHAELGGQTQSGISPSSKSPIVMLFSDSVSGEQYGYFDGWHDDGMFHYSGEGQRGDQEMKRGNKALRDHEQLQREVHVFLGSGKGLPVTYLGRFRYVDYYETDAPEIGGGPVRKVFMFRLQPLDALPPRSLNTVSPAKTTTVQHVPVENHFSEKVTLDPSRTPTEAERREAALVQKYKQYLEKTNRVPVRNRIQPAGEAKPLFTDIFDPDRNLLVEAKGSVTREAIRMALGQLLDYARFFQPRPNMAVLVPSAMRADLRQLLAEYQIGVIEQTEIGFDEYLVEPTK